jgi:AGZA family xanthine/uracil permease-like MFS transporter
MQWIYSYFRLKENNTDLKTEFIAGITTFMTMAYIIFVNPAILANAMGMDKFQAIAAATCLASALTTLIMAFWARYPVALAPGMGLNAFFAFTLCLSMNVPWQTGLGIVFICGILVTLLSLLQTRQMIIEAIPQTLKIAAAVGIGIFIAFIGLKEAGIVVEDSNTLVTLGNLKNPNTILALFGLVLTAGLMARKVKGAILWGILGTGGVGLGFGIIQYTGVFGMPTIHDVFGKLDIKSALKVEYIGALIVMLFFDMFDTIGTLIGLGEKGGFLKDGKLERATPALMSDSFGTMIGAVCGTSTVTSYIESSAGISEGGRTGLASFFTALLFFAALFFGPLAHMLGGGCEIEKRLVTVDKKFEIELNVKRISEDLKGILRITKHFLSPEATVIVAKPSHHWIIQDKTKKYVVETSRPNDAKVPTQLNISVIEYLYPITAPALIIVGFLMLSCIRSIGWDDYTEAIPAFLTIIIMPLTYSISHGLVIGFISYAILKLLSGRGKEVSCLMYILSVLFIVGYCFFIK